MTLNLLKNLVRFSILQAKMKKHLCMKEDTEQN